MADTNDTPTESTEATESGTESAQGTQPTYTDSEKAAMAQGWVPEDQYDGSAKWRTAEDFLDRGELFAKIDEQKRRASALEGTLHEVKRHLKVVRETEYKRAINQLLANKKNALDEGDSERVVAIDEQMNTVKADAARSLQAMDQPIQVSQTHPQLQVWINRNPWYEQDVAMRTYADNYGTNLAARGMTDIREILQEVERSTKKEFSNKFTNPNRSRPGSVEGGGAKGNQSRDSFQLNEAETKMMNRFVRAGVMTKDQYIADIKEAEKQGKR